MVVIHYKRSEHNQFLYETTVEIKVKDLVNDMVELNNLRFKIDQLAIALEELARHGPLRPEDLRGLSEDISKLSLDQGLSHDAHIPTTDRFVEDPTHFRTGYVVSQDVCTMMLTTAQEAKAKITHELVKQRKNLAKAELLTQLDLIRGAVMIGYPGYHGLPEWEPVRLILEGQDIEVKSQDVEIFDPSCTTIWWAGKELVAGKLLKDYIGKNEKTKIVAKLQKSGSGAPVREPVVDEETQKKMMAFYHKKQEEVKKMDDDNEDAYMNSAWANPRGLKDQLNGQGNVKWR